MRETRSGTNLEGLSFAIAAPTIQEQLPVLKSPATPQATPTQAPTRIPTEPPPIANRFGPVSGQIETGSEDKDPHIVQADVNLDDLVVEATFINPANPNWLYSLSIRTGLHHEEVDGLLIAVYGLGEFRIETITSQDAIVSGNVSSLNVLEGEKNHITVMALEEQGWLFVNQTFIASFDVSSLPNEGDSSITASVLAGEQTTIEFENFRGHAPQKALWASIRNHWPRHSEVYAGLDIN